MPFGSVPILHGRFFTYRAYFALLAALGLIYAVIVCCALGLWVRTRAYRKIASIGNPDATTEPARAATELSAQADSPSSRFNPDPSSTDVAPGKPRATGCAGACVYIFMLIAGVLLAALFIGAGLADFSYLYVFIASLFFIVPAVLVTGFLPASLGTGRPFFSVALYLVAGLVIQFMWFGFLSDAVGIILCIFPMFAGLWLAISFEHPPAFCGDAEPWKRGVLVGVIAVAISVVLGVGGSGFCLDIYQEHVPGFVSVDAIGFSLSAHWSRPTFHCEPLWPEDPKAPCHLYLTIPEDASTSVFVNMHFPKGSQVATVYATPEQADGASSSSAVATRFEMGMLRKGNRDVNSALLSGLTPATLYRLQIRLGDANLTMPTTAPWRFRTAPEHQNPTTLAMCGDMGTYDDAAKLLRLAGASPTALDAPSVFVVGGDIAYDNGMPTCYCAWDSWLGFYGEAASSTGFLIPFVLVVGNHDTGTEAVQFATPPNVNRAELPFFTFFPHHSKGVGPNGEAGVPSLKDRWVSHAHRVGNTMILALDSGYVQTSFADGEQVKWAEGILVEDKASASPAQTTIASYHVPIYPSTKEHHHEWGEGASGAFVKLFDDNGVLFAMENHVHAFKRTVALRNSQPHESGTIYFGDGRAGVSGVGVPSQEHLIAMADEHRLAVESQAISHIWLINVTSQEASFVAIDTAGAPIDTVSRTLDPVAKRQAGIPLMAGGQEEERILHEG